MTYYVPWIAVALAVVALVFCLSFGSKRGADASPRKTLSESWPTLAMLLGLSAVAIVCGFKWGKDLDGFQASGFGLAAGAVAIYIVSVLTRTVERGEWAIPVVFGIPTALLGMSHWWRNTDNIPWLQLGMVVGAMIAVVLLSIGADASDKRWPDFGATFLGAIVAADFMGRFGLDGAMSLAGVALGSAAVLATFLAALLVSKGGKVAADLSGFTWGSVCALFLALIGAIVARKYLGADYSGALAADLTYLILGSIVLAAVVHWFLGEDDRSSVRLGLAVALWLGAATLAYSMRKGAGMSVCLATAVATLTMLGNKRAMMSLAPLAGLVFYRVFRETEPDAARALDIGQHYAMVGLLVGATLPLILVEWIETARKTMVGRGLWAGAVWVVLVVGVPLAALILLGPKGAVGYLVGLGLAAFVHGLKGSSSLLALTLAMGLAATMALAYGWLVDVLDMTREAKTAVLLRILFDVVALSVLLVLLSRDRKEKGTV